MNQARPVCAADPYVAAVKRVGRSPLMLLLCIGATLSFACAGIPLLWDVLSSAALLSLLPEQSALMELPFSVTGVSDLGFWLKGVGVLAFWLVYAACRNDRRPQFSTGGLTVLRCLAVLQTILAGLALFLAITAGSFCIVLVFTARDGLFRSLLPHFAPFGDLGVLEGLTSAGFSVALVLIVAGVIGLLAFHLAGNIARVRALSSVAHYGQGLPTRPISLFACLYCMIGLLLPLFPTATEEGFLAVAGHLFAVLCGIFSGILLLRLRHTVADGLMQPITPQGNPTEDTASAEQESDLIATGEAKEEAEGKTAEAPNASLPVVQDPPQDGALVDEPISPRFCTRCGQKLTEHQRFCNNCGKPVQ